jgi:hypothetical protein
LVESVKVRIQAIFLTSLLGDEGVIEGLLLIVATFHFDFVAFVFFQIHGVVVVVSA